MSRQQRDIRKLLPGLPLPRSVSSSTPKLQDHRCCKCGRHGGFGTVKRDVNGNIALDNGAEWYCGDHVPWQTGSMKPTFQAKFERAWFDVRKTASGG